MSSFPLPRLGSLTAAATTVQAIPSEAEVLLPAGIALKVTSVLSKDASGLTIVTLEDDEEVTPLLDGGTV